MCVCIGSEGWQGGVLFHFSSAGSGVMAAGGRALAGRLGLMEG